MELAQNTSAPTKLTDIPLSVDEPGEAKTLDEKMLSSKTNSLKRFFKMSNKRVTDGLTNASENQMKGPIESDIESGSSAKEKTQLHRFHLRLGAFNRNAQSQILANNNSSVASSSSKPGLKGSISNYWNSVFKRTQSESIRKKGGADVKEAKNNDDDDDDEEEEEEEEQNETQICEEVHTLPVSEESDDASKS